MKLPFEEVWQRSIEQAGIQVRSPRYLPFSYSISGDYVIPSTVSIRLPKRNFEKAWAKMPVSGPEDLYGLGAPSILLSWRILE